ncbi:hypothetical protein PLESTB_000587100 [Pleodorina starrii]|uniref:Cyclin-like domain-containing protein n=1 Tax=Pleodorina starrii TaxID=330485 RepID=A0A9W6F0I0_9CHLO|nr:hypothetical protein PLESTM_000297700 [Pleodorina starrii]GLC52138.1 hypothetical protein PLESTB_000587100 [Pleodorina starrii]GLC72279.1 hypothetical protein PLESTF_001227100 [Pleodorina starrii]
MHVVPVLKVDGATLLCADSDSASPECGSASISPSSLANSSGCASLLCTEGDLDDCDMEDEDALGDEVRELCVSYRVYAGCHRLHLPLVRQSDDATRIGACLRDDLEKQAQQHRTASGRCSPACSTAAPDKTAAAASSAAGIGIVGGSCSAPPPRCRLPAAYRARMVGWMREVSEALCLHVSTLFAATSLLDRFVAAAEVLPSNELLQLLTLACMSVAVKYNEVTQLGPALWLGLAVDESGRQLYQARDLQRCEFSLLQTVDWRLRQPNTHTFLEHFLMCIPAGAVPLAEPAAAPAAVAAPETAGVAAAGDAAAEPAAAAAAAEAAAAGDAEADAVAGSRSADCLLAEGALALAEVSRLFSGFVSYEYSTVAMACLTLAERMMHGGGDDAAAAAAAVPGGGDSVGPAAAAACAAAGLPLPLLAPGLVACVRDLEGCYGQLLAAAAAARQPLG